MARDDVGVLSDHGGYPPLEDLGLVGDGCTAALIARDATVVWMCVPRFDSDPLFCSILDARRGGSFRIAPVGVREATQYYEKDTGVLITELRTPTAHLRVTDCLTVQRGSDLSQAVAVARGELLRSVRVLEGDTTLKIQVEPRGGATAERSGDGLRVRPVRRPDLDLHLRGTVPLHGLTSRVDVEEGSTTHLALRWGGDAHREEPAGPPERIDATIRAWRHWSKRLEYEGPQAVLVRRSALVLKMLDYRPTGALLAAPTSSLPEAIGGERNWDYRYAWVRDTAFSVYALRRVGLMEEAWSFLSWVLEAVERTPQASVMYDVDGLQPPAERVDRELEGYRRSPPVRWGNAAAAQRQHDVWGEILDCAYQWVARGGNVGPLLWSRLVALVERAADAWREPDHGVWEVRTPGRVFTYSAAMCQVALERGARLAERLDLPAPTRRWRTEAERVRNAILEQAWDPERLSLTEHLGGGGLDASVLSLPLRRVVEPRHPKMVSTVDAVQRRLGAGNGLLYRYLPEESPDGIAGGEGAFLLCSFWLVDNLAYQGRLEEAVDLYDSLSARAGRLGLLPEEIEVSNGAFLGNYPQAFSHVGVISSGVNLARLSRTSW
jgi:GH15 family glucan-1,4-alpha-glucosidase